MTDVQQARIEAAARAMWEAGDPREPTWPDLPRGVRQGYLREARAALQAADAMVTVDMIAAVLNREGAQCGDPLCHREPGDPVDCGDCSRVLDRYAAAVHALYRGEEQS